MAEPVNMCQNIRIVRRKLAVTCPHCQKQWSMECDVPNFCWPDGNAAICCDSCHVRITAAEQSAAEKNNRERMFSETGIPEAFGEWDPTVGNNSLARFIRDNRAKSMLLFGDVNLGKSRSVAYNLLLEVKEGARGRFVNFKAAVDQYSAYRQESCFAALSYLRELAALDVLVLDDFGKRAINETAGEFAYDLINRIYEGSSRIWITSNDCNLSHMLAKFSNSETGAAVVSRFDRMADDNRMIIQEVAHVGKK